jgi:hypothetical protein
MVVRDLDYRLPAETSRVVDEMQLRFCPTIEYDVEPVVVLEALGRLILVITECALANGRAAFTSMNNRTSVKVLLSCGCGFWQKELHLRRDPFRA